MNHLVNRYVIIIRKLVSSFNKMLRKNNHEKYLYHNSTVKTYSYQLTVSVFQLLKVLEEENNVAVLPSQFSFGDMCTSTDIQPPAKHEEKVRASADSKKSANIIRSKGDDADLNNLKGQNLKWKIIIKHHGTSVTIPGN